MAFDASIVRAYRPVAWLWQVLGPWRYSIGAPLVMLLLSACSPRTAGAPSTAPATATVSAAVSPSACEVRDFEATVLQGKDAGLTLHGTLILQADAAGRLTTRFTTTDGKATRGSGQVNGRAINLFFELGGGKNIFGTGTLDHDFRECTGVLGGTLAGPDRNDTGAWGCSCCPCYIRTISPTLGLAPRAHAVRALASGGRRDEAIAVLSGKLRPASR